MFKIVIFVFLFLIFMSYTLWSFTWAYWMWVNKEIGIIATTSLVLSFLLSYFFFKKIIIAIIEYKSNS
jgi:hypothetical protein